MKFATVKGVKYSMDIVQTPEISPAEARRQVQIRRRYQREERAQRWAGFRRGLFTAIRRLITLTVLASICAFAWSNREKIKFFVSKELRVASAYLHNRSDSDALRQAALNHEKESESPLER